MSKKVKASTGNVFTDLSLPDPQHSLAKAELARLISGLIEDRGFKQVEAAAALGVDPAKVSALVNGRLEGFSTDRLLRFLNLLDCDVEIVVRAKKSRGSRIRVVQRK